MLHKQNNLDTNPFRFCTDIVPLLLNLRNILGYLKLWCWKMPKHEQCTAWHKLGYTLISLSVSVCATVAIRKKNVGSFSLPLKCHRKIKLSMRKQEKDEFKVWAYVLRQQEKKVHIKKYFLKTFQHLSPNLRVNKWLSEFFSLTWLSLSMEILFETYEGNDSLG